MMRRKSNQTKAGHFESLTVHQQYGLYLIICTMMVDIVSMQIKKSFNILIYLVLHIGLLKNKKTILIL